MRRIGFEAEHVTYQRLALWKRKYKNTKFIHTSEAVEWFRRGKENEELRYLQRAERITEELLRRVPHALKKGITEEELARKIAIWALELGAEGVSFDPIVAFGTHTSSPHHRPTSRTSKRPHRADRLWRKIPWLLRGSQRSFFHQSPTSFQKRVYEILFSEARDAAMEQARAGASTHLLDRTARDILKREGIEHAFTHSLGHGVGLDIHEGVTLSSKAKEEKLLRREVITIEPGVYFPGTFGMRLESMVYVD